MISRDWSYYMKWILMEMDVYCVMPSRIIRNRNVMRRRLIWSLPVLKLKILGVLRIIFSFLYLSISEGKARFLLHVFISPWMEFMLQKCELFKGTILKPWLWPRSLFVAYISWLQYYRALILEPRPLLIWLRKLITNSSLLCFICTRYYLSWTGAKLASFKLCLIFRVKLSIWWSLVGLPPKATS